MRSVKPFANNFEFQEICATAGAYAPKYDILLQLGVFTGLRVSDLLHLRKKDVLTPNFCVIEIKTKKKRCFTLPTDLHEYISAYIDAVGLANSDYLIFSTQNHKDRPLSRVQAYRVLKKASLQNGLTDIGTHSMRKTFACEHYKTHKDINALQKELNHKYITTTLMYLFDVSSIADVPTFITPQPVHENALQNVLTLKLDFTPIKKIWAFIRKLWH